MVAKPESTEAEHNMLEDSLSDNLSGNSTEDDTVFCPSCHRKFKDPRILNCLHVFCYACMQGNVDEIEGCPETKLCCPKCEQVTTLPSGNIDSLPVDYVIQNSVEMGSVPDDTSSLVCTSCKGKEQAVARCSNCVSYLCSNCVTAHQFMRCFENHQVRQLSELQNGNDALNDQHTTACSLHKTEILKYFCNTCQEPICNECMLSKHKIPEHHLELVAEVQEKHRQEVEHMVKETKKRLEMQKSHRVQMDEQLDELQMQRDNAKSAIEEAFQSYKAILEKKRDSTLKQLHTIHKEKELEILDCVMSLETSTDKIEDGIALAERFLDKAGSVELLLVKKAVCNQLRSLLGQPVKPALDVQIEFSASNEGFSQGVEDTFGKVLKPSQVCQSASDVRLDTQALPGANDSASSAPSTDLSSPALTDLAASHLNADLSSLNINTDLSTLGSQLLGVDGPLPLANLAINAGDMVPSMLKAQLPSTSKELDTAEHWDIERLTNSGSSHLGNIISLQQMTLSNSLNPSMGQLGGMATVADHAVSSSADMLMCQAPLDGGSVALNTGSLGLRQSALPLNQPVLSMPVAERRPSARTSPEQDLGADMSMYGSQLGKHANIPGMPANQMMVMGGVPPAVKGMYPGSMVPPSSGSVRSNFGQLDTGLNLGVAGNRSHTPSALDVSNLFAAQANVCAYPSPPQSMQGNMNAVLGSGSSGSSSTMSGSGGLSSATPSLHNPSPHPPVSQRQGKTSAMQIRCKFGQLGPGKCQFNSPHGFCLGTDEEIVVADTNNHRIQVFEKTGEFKYQFGIPGREEGQLWYPRKVVVIRQSGKYVVCDRGNERSRMQIFTKSGHFLKKIAIRYIDIVAGLAITQQGDIVAVDSVSPTVFRINDAGDLIKWFDCSDYMREPSDIGVCGKEYFVCDFKGHCVVVFNEDGEFQRRIGCENITNFPNGIDISDAGDILIGDSHGNRFHVAVFQKDGSLIGEFECPYVKVSRCCGLKITSEGYIVTLAKNNHHVLVLNTLYIQ